MVLYEAEPWFGAIANRPGETETIPDIHEMLTRTGLLTDMAFYFLYEAADTVLRMQNCKLDMQGVLLQMLPGFFSTGTQLSRFNELFADQPIDRSKLMLTLPEETFLKLTKTNREIVARYLRNGITVVLDGLHPENVDVLQLMELGFSHVRLAPELYLKQETAQYITMLREKGFTVLGCGADTFDLLAWQVACGISATRGSLTGIAVNEEELIRDCLLRER